MVWSYSIEPAMCQKEDILSDVRKFFLSTYDDILQNLKTILRFLYWLQKTALAKKIVLPKVPHFSQLPHHRTGYPNTHKAGNLMRPILSLVGSFNHEAAK